MVCVVRFLEQGICPGRKLLETGLGIIEQDASRGRVSVDGARGGGGDVGAVFSEDMGPERLHRALVGGHGHGNA